MISNVHVSVDQKYSVYGGEQVCTVNLMANLTNFSTLLGGIGKTSGMLSCLFVPNLADQDQNKYHAFWSDNQEDKVHLGQITNYIDSTNIDEDDSKMEIHYSEIECNEIDCSNIKSNTINSGSINSNLIESESIINNGSIESESIINNGSIKSDIINSRSINNSDIINSVSIKSDTIQSQSIISDTIICSDYKLIDEIKKLNYIENFYTTWHVYDQQPIKGLSIEPGIHTHIISWYKGDDNVDDVWTLDTEQTVKLMKENNINHLKYHIINKTGQKMKLSFKRGSNIVNYDIYEDKQIFIQFYREGEVYKYKHTVF